MDEIYLNYLDDEHVDNHDYDDNTGDDRDSNIMSLSVHLMHGSTLVYI